MTETEKTPRYSGSCTFNKKTLTEATWATMRGARTWIRVGIALLFLGVGIFFLVTAIRYQQPLFHPILLLVLALLYAALLPANVYFITRRQLKRMEEMQSIDTRLTFSFFEAELSVASTLDGKEDKTPYDRIIRVQQTKNLLLIWRRQRLFYFIEKSSLSGGAPAGVIAFLQEKNPQIKTR